MSESKLVGVRVEVLSRAFRATPETFSGPLDVYYYSPLRLDIFVSTAPSRFARDDKLET